MQIHSPSELDRLGDEIAELSAHLDAATAREALYQRARVSDREVGLGNVPRNRPGAWRATPAWC